MSRRDTEEPACLPQMWPLGFCPEADAAAARLELGHWSCASPRDNSLWLRIDGRYEQAIDCVWAERLIRFDEANPISDQWVSAFESKRLIAQAVSMLARIDAAKRRSAAKGLRKVAALVAKRERHPIVEASVRILRPLTSLDIEAAFSEDVEGWDL